MFKNKSYYALLSIIISAFGGAAQPAYADEAPYEGTVFGDWGGVRKDLHNAGVDVGLAYQGDVMAVTNGGIKRGQNYMDNLDITAEFDGEKLLGIQGNRAVIHFINNAGG